MMMGNSTLPGLSREPLVGVKRSVKATELVPECIALNLSPVSAVGQSPVNVTGYRLCARIRQAHFRMEVKKSGTAEDNLSSLIKEMEGFLSFQNNRIIQMQHPDAA